MCCNGKKCLCDNKIKQIIHTVTENLENLAEKKVCLKIYKLEATKENF